ncbi:MULTISPECIES: CBO0543 family protein [Bacillaceae]|uniref:Uncharacterized protein n=1 Tax=Evansella alkalicola TaxID=745819 RepID=A0ABS6K2J8_9BACI|nr:MULTISPECIES: CBO0543 family protein [Bacillaceae]MBU9724245.1 hypothetical protein [Bacillus alkalicola]
MARVFQKYFLTLTTLVSLSLLPFAIVKRSFKDWIIVFLVSILGNSMADRYLVSRGFLKYKVRPLPDKFGIHLPFDFIHYPLLLLYFNQWTLNSKPLGMILKLLLMVTPQVAIETYAAEKTNLITWRKGWSWKHSFVSMMIKFLLCRLIIAGIRVINKRSISTS